MPYCPQAKENQTTTQQRGEKMENLPKTITQTMYVLLTPYDEIKLAGVPMTDHGYTTLGEVTVTVDVPQADVAALKLQTLEAKRDATQTEYAEKINRIDDEIQKLQALEYQPEAPE